LTPNKTSDLIKKDVNNSPFHDFKKIIKTNKTINSTMFTYEHVNLITNDNNLKTNIIKSKRNIKEINPKNLSPQTPFESSDDNINFLK